MTEDNTFDALRVAYEQGQHDCASTHAIRGLKDINRIAARGYDDGQRDALAAAREAVSAALSHEDHCKGQIRKICNCSRFDALAAIDALREKQ